MIKALIDKRYKNKLEIVGSETDITNDTANILIGVYSALGDDPKAQRKWRRRMIMCLLNAKTIQRKVDVESVKIEVDTKAMRNLIEKFKEEFEDESI